MYTAALAQDLRNLIVTNPGAESLRQAALGDPIEQAERATNEATSALPAEGGAQAAVSEATLGGNELLVRALAVPKPRELGIPAGIRGATRPVRRAIYLPSRTSFGLPGARWGTEIADWAGVPPRPASVELCCLAAQVP